LRERIFTKHAFAPQEQLALTVDAGRLEGSVNFYDLPEFKRLDIDWSLGSCHLITDAELEHRVVATRENLTLSGQEK
jgi:hypothetical protein